MQLIATALCAVRRAGFDTVEYAYANPDASRDYVRSLSKEMSDEVCAAHVALYVNEHSVDIRQILDDLEGDHAVSRHDISICDRMDERSGTSFATVIHERRPPLVVRQCNDRRAQPFDCVDLRTRSCLRHYDGARNAGCARARE